LRAVTGCGFDEPVLAFAFGPERPEVLPEPPLVEAPAVTSPFEDDCEPEEDEEDDVEDPDDDVELDEVCAAAERT
jgi:hypothetical protein